MSSDREALRGEAALAYVQEALACPLETLLAFPRFFLVETTSLCNARCRMCAIDFDSKKKAVMSDELFAKALTEIAPQSAHIEKVALYLEGEPLLDKKLPWRIEKMKKAGIKRVNIATNASLLDPPRAERLIKAGLDEIYIGIDSLRKEVFEAIRGGLDFETVYENTIRFIQLRDKLNPALVIRIQMILQELNRGEADSFPDHWKPLLKQNDQIVVQKVHNWGAAIKTMEFGDEETINDVPCIALWGTFCIHVDGEVSLCCADINSTIPLGNIRTQSVQEMWSGELLQTMRQKHTRGQRHEIPICNGCTLWRESKHDRKEVIE